MMTDDDDLREDRKKKSDNSLAQFMVFLGIVFLPATIVAFLYIPLLRKGRLKLSVIASIGVFVSFLAIVFWKISDAGEKLLSVFKNITEFTTNWTDIIPALIVVNVILGSIAGLIMVAIQVNKLKKNPYELQFSNTWMYHFKFRRTPLEYFKRKSIIKGLGSGQFAEETKAPLGLEEDKDKVVYRYNTEAVRQTLISGAAGSGKALHKDTLIPTLNGFKTVENIEKGDIIFDDGGRPTKILGKFQPLTETHFEMEMSDGTRIRTTGDHLWELEVFSGHPIRNSRPILSDSGRQKAVNDLLTVTNERIAFTEFCQTYGIINAFAIQNILHDVLEENNVVPVETALTIVLSEEKLRDEIREKNHNSEIVREILTTAEIFKNFKNRRIFNFPTTEKVEYEKRSLPVDPYLLGAFLVGSRQDFQSFCEKYDIAVDENFTTFVDSLTNRKIPDIFKISSCVQRQQFVSGVMDVAGDSDSLGAYVESDSSDFLEDFKSIINSLAWMPGRIFKRNNQHRFHFFPDEQVFTILDKVSLFKKITPVHKYVVRVTEIEDKKEDYYCFEVDSPSHLFLCSESYLPTHNTITMLSLMLNDIMNGIPIVVIDFKQSPELSSKLSAWCHEYDSNFYHFMNGNPKNYDVQYSPGQSTYDPLLNGGAGKADMVLNMREYDTASAVYKMNMAQLLQVLFSMLKYADKRKAPHIDWTHGTIYQVTSAISGNLTELAVACEGTPIEKEAEEIDAASRSKTSQLRHAMDELQGQMRTLTASAYGPWLKLSKDQRNIDLYKLTSSSNNVILFSLNSDSEKDFSKFIGSLILSDLNSLSSKRRNSGLKNQVNVYVDEFQAVSPTAVTTLLEKSRESRLGMTLSSQSFEQIISASDQNGEAYLKGILDTCSNFIIHNGATESSATRVAELIGKAPKETYRRSNKNKGGLFSFNFFNKRDQIIQTGEEIDWIVPPQDFMKLSSPSKGNGQKSTAMIINKTSDDPQFKNKSGAVCRHTWMIPNKLVIADYFIPTIGMNDEEEEFDHDEIVDLKPEETPAENLLMDNNDVDDSGYDYGLFDDEEEESEDDDGDFGWEETASVADEQTDVESLPPLDIVTPHISKRRSVSESSTFESMFAEKKKPVQKISREKPVQKKNTVDDEPDDLDSLPDITF